MTIGSAIGGGLNVKLFSNLDLFAAIKLGITCSDYEVVVDYDWRDYHDPTKFNLIGQAHLGLTIDIYKISKQ